MAPSREIEKLQRRWQENPSGLTFAPLAEAYRKEGLYLDALELLTIGLARHPNYVPAHIVRGRCYVDTGSPYDAEQAFLEVTHLDPENVIAFKYLADLAEEDSRLLEAMAWLERLLDLDLNNDEAQEQLDRVRARLIAEKEEDEKQSVAPNRGSDSQAAVNADQPSGEWSESSPTMSLSSPPFMASGAAAAGTASAGKDSADATPKPSKESAPEQPMESGSQPPTETTPSTESDSRPSMETASQPSMETAQMESAFQPSMESASQPSMESGSQTPTETVDQLETESLAASDRSERSEAEARPDDPSAGEEPTRDTAADEPALQPIHVEVTSEEIEVRADRPNELGVEKSSELQVQAKDKSDELEASAEGSSGVRPCVERAQATPEVVLAEALPVSSESPGTPAPEPTMAETEQWEGEGGAPADAPIETAAATPGVTDAHIEEVPAEDGLDFEDDLVVTETMAEVFVRQGHRQLALAVYQQLLNKDPGNARIRSAIVELSGDLPKPPTTPSLPTYAAVLTGGQSVRSFFERLLASRRPGAPGAPSGGNLSLGAVFGEDRSKAGVSEADASSGPSFDEFYSEPPPPRDPSPARESATEDLESFTTWLKGLKR